MTKICVIAAAIAAAVLAFAATPASAKACDDDTSACPQLSSPMKLDQFMKTWKPVTVSKQKKKYRTSRTSRRAPVHEARKHHVPAREKETTETKVAAATPVAAAAPEAVMPPAPENPPVAVSPEPAVETTGVGVTSFNEVNELDTKAARVQIVAFNEVNEIDLTAPPPLPAPKAPKETMGQSVSSTPGPADSSWIGKLLLAAAGTLALAGAARLLVA